MFPSLSSASTLAPSSRRRNASSFLPLATAMGLVSGKGFVTHQQIGVEVRIGVRVEGSGKKIGYNMVRVKNN